MIIISAVRRLKNSPYWRDVVLLASGNAMAQVVGVVATPLLTRLYAPADFALQSLFIQVLGFAVVLLTCRYEYFLQLPKSESDAISLLLLVLCLCVLGFALATPPIWLFRHRLASLLGVATLAPWLALLPLTAALVCFSTALQNLAQRRGQYGLSSQSEIVNKGCSAGTALAGYVLVSPPGGLMLASAAGAIGKIAWLSRRPESAGHVRLHLADLAAKLGNYTLGSLRRMAVTYSHLAGSVVVSHLLMACTTTIPSIFIVRAYGTESLGQFALASATIYLPSGFISNSIGQVYYQRAAERRAHGANFADLWRSTARRLILAGLPIYGLLAIVCPWVYPLVFGASWVDAGRYASLMSVSAFFAFITAPMDRGCLVVGAWAYMPLWHSARVLSTAFVAWLAWRNGWTIHAFVAALVLQTSILFLVDYWAEHRFAVSTVVGKPA